MLRTYLLVFVAAFTITSLIAGEHATSSAKQTRILYIGNSLTFYNELPEVVQEIADSKGHSISADMYAPGGSKLSDHVANDELTNIISGHAWDIVVLQEQSQLPSFGESQLKKEVYPYARKLVQNIRTSNPKARIIFYMGMANKDGDVRNKQYYPALATYEGTQPRINSTYRTLASQNNAEVAPVGVAWQQMRRSYPQVELYSDDRHPNPTGTYLASCVIFSTIYKEKCAGAEIVGNVDDSTGAILQAIADQAR